MNFMQYEKSLLNRDDPFDLWRRMAGDQADKASEKAGKGAPGGQQAERSEQKEKGLLNTLREQGLGNPGGIGDMIGSQPASSDYEPEVAQSDTGSAQGQQANARKGPSSSDDGISKPPAERGQQERSSRNARPARPGNNPRSSPEERDTWDR